MGVTVGLSVGLTCIPKLNSIYESSLECILKHNEVHVVDFLFVLVLSLLLLLLLLAMVLLI